MRCILYEIVYMYTLMINVWIVSHAFNILINCPCATLDPCEVYQFVWAIHTYYTNELLHVIISHRDISMGTLSYKYFTYICIRAIFISHFFPTSDNYLFVWWPRWIVMSWRPNCTWCGTTCRILRCYNSIVEQSRTYVLLYILYKNLIHNIMTFLI